MTLARHRRVRLHRLQFRPPATQRRELAASSGLVNLDKLTYAGNPANLADRRQAIRAMFCRTATSAIATLVGEPAHRARHRRGREFRRGVARRPFDRWPRGLHPDQRRRHAAAAQAVRAATGPSSPAEKKRAFRFLHVSTDEVYGTLGRTIRPSPRRRPSRQTAPTPRSKAASDHLVRAYQHTYGLPMLTTNCSNNYGPLSVPGKADPADDPERPGGQAAAGLRRRA